MVKPSGHHLKLALKMRNFAKAMFKPMRWELNPHLVNWWSSSNTIQAQKSTTLEYVVLQNILKFWDKTNCYMALHHIIWLLIYVWLTIWSFFIFWLMCLWVYIQAAEGWWDSWRLLLFCWFPETQCRNRCISPGQVQPPFLHSLLLYCFSCFTVIIYFGCFECLLSEFMQQ